MVEAAMKNSRPWGDFTTLYESKDTKVKVITVLPKHRLSYQSHENRSEHWVVVSGQGLVTIEGDSSQHLINDYIYIPTKVKHRIQNTGDSNLVFVEIQTGSSFEEGDIVRYDDDYGRTE